MQTRDCAAKIFFCQENEFAEVFNWLFFQGKAVVRPGNLQERNPEQNLLRRGDDERTPAGERRSRDLLKMHVCRSDGRNTYLLLGMELQSAACRAMPVRMMCYDAREYERQTRESDFSSGGMLKPVLSLVINLGENPWTGPKSIADLFPPMAEGIRNALIDYPMRLLDPHRMTDEEIAKFSNELQYVFRAIKYGKDEKKLHAVLSEGSPLVKPETADCVAALLGLPMDMARQQEGGKVNMCSVIEKWREEDLAKGREEGMAKGREEGMRDMLRNALMACRRQNMPEEMIFSFLRQMAGDAFDLGQFFSAKG